VLVGNKRISTKRKFVADGVFYAELNELLTRELAEEGYAGVEVRTTPHRTELVIRATRTQNVLGENNRRIRELTSAVQKRFDFADGAVELYAERVHNRGLCAAAQAESLKYKLLGGLAVRRACYGVVRFVMEAKAKGCEVVVSGKLRGQRAKGMKFGDGYMIKTGHAGQVYIDMAVRHVLLRSGVIGIKVSIMLPQDPRGIMGPKIPLDDVVTILEPKEELSPAAMLAAQQMQAPMSAPSSYPEPAASDPMGAPVDAVPPPSTMDMAPPAVSTMSTPQAVVEEPVMEDEGML
jgi:small subunit ribosomal protein S3e